MEITAGQIVKVDYERHELIIRASYDEINPRMLHQYLSNEVMVGLKDGREISEKQRRKVYVLLKHISEWSGYEPIEVTKETHKLMFLLEQPIMQENFSLSNCDMTIARLYIDYLIRFCLFHNVPCNEPLQELCEDIGRYVYACLMNKVCCVCGRPAELHHREAVGMGRNRKEIPQLGMAVLPLCRVHHTEAHNIGQRTFLNKYHLQTVKLTKEIGKKYNLTSKNLKSEVKI